MKIQGASSWEASGAPTQKVAQFLEEAP